LVQELESKGEVGREDGKTSRRTGVGVGGGKKEGGLHLKKERRTLLGKWKVSKETEKRGSRRGEGGKKEAATKRMLGPTRGGVLRGSLKQKKTDDRVGKRKEEKGGGGEPRKELSRV